MAYPWDLAGDDPLNYGMLQAAGSLLTPERQGGGMGPALSRFGQTVANQRNINEQQELTKLKIDAYKRDLKNGVEQGDPSSIREWKYFNKLNPADQQKFLDMKRQNYKQFQIGDVPHEGHLGTGEAPRALATVDQVAGNKGRIAADIAYNKAMMESGFDVKETVDSRNQPTYNTVLEILGNRRPQNPSAGFNAFQNQAQRAAGPPASQPQDYPATPAGLNQARTDLAAQFGNAMPPPQGNSGIRPAVAGAADRKKESKAAEGTAEYDNETYKAATDAAEGNRALDKISAMIAQSKVTGGPLAKPEVWARNTLSEFGIPLNGALDANNARLSAVASQRLASKIMKGGRSLTDTDVRLIAASFPGFDSGIPYEQLPSFIEMVKSMNNDSISTWQKRSKEFTPEYKRNFPGTFDEPKANPSNDLRKKHGLPPL